MVSLGDSRDLGSGNVVNSSAMASRLFCEFKTLLALRLAFEAPPVSSGCSAVRVSRFESLSLDATAAGERLACAGPASVGRSRWAGRMTPEDYRGLTQLIYSHVNPYGRFDLDLNSRIDFGRLAA